jgi:predicted DNA-binding transcriptional regulator AlpA
MAERIITKTEAAQRLGVSVPTLDRREAQAAAAGDGTFPRRRQLGPGRVGFLESEVDAYLRALPVGPLSGRTAAASTPEARAKAKATRAAGRSTAA